MTDKYHQGTVSVNGIQKNCDVFVFWKASEMSKSLKAQGKSVAPVYLSERWSSAFAVSKFLDFAFKGTPISRSFVPAGADGFNVADML